jgi:lysophospholipase L1-like esterase
VAASGTAVAVALLLGSTTSAGADPSTAGQPGPYYVAIGASESVGVQPEPWDRHGVRTDKGYADDLTRMEQRRWQGLQLVDYGCPGITAQGALDGLDDCHYAAGSEVATAVDFIGAHADDIAFVTVDLGFNDIRPCLAHHVVDGGCVEAALRRISVAVRTVLGELRAAGGQDLLIVGLQHADPYVADALFGEVGFARKTVPVFDRMNEVLASAYAAAGAVVARVGASSERVAGPRAVENTCTRTWMCTDHNIHPTAAGYRVIADAIADAIADSSDEGPAERLAPVRGEQGAGGPRRSSRTTAS